jgi:LPS sulfotransferase NodH
MRFMVLGDARSGSTVLVNALNSHPNVRCFREPFNWSVNFIDYGIEGWDPVLPSDAELRARDPVAFINQRLFCGHPLQYSAIGFKFLYMHFWGFPGLLEHLEQDSDLRVIHIVRDNSLRALVSLHIAESTGQWVDDGRQRSAAPRGSWARRLSAPIRDAGIRLGVIPTGTIERGAGGPRVRLTESECRDYFSKAERRHAHWSSLFEGHDILNLKYEELLADRNAFFGRVQRFLFLPEREAAVTLRRQNPQPLTEILLNYGALRRAFAGTPYERFFMEEG